MDGGTNGAQNIVYLPYPPLFCSSQTPSDLSQLMSATPKHVFLLMFVRGGGATTGGRCEEVLIHGTSFHSLYFMGLY